MPQPLKPKRILAIGDIHGYPHKLNRLLDVVQPTTEDKLFFLGDYVDRGPDSRGVLDTLISIKEKLPQTIFIRGNHEQMLIDAVLLKRIETSLGAEETVPLNQKSILEELEIRAAFFGLLPTDLARIWLREGGLETLASYQNSLEKVPLDHLSFLQQTKFYHAEYLEKGQASQKENTGFLFVHAGINLNVPFQHQHPLELMNRRDFPEPDNRSPWTVVHGHTIRLDGPIFMPNRINLDTGVYINTGKLTCCDVLTRQVWQI